VVAILEKVVSDGQTGADRAALDWAIANGMPHGGWCHRGRKAEDGATENRFQLKETPSASYIQRTAWNVRDSDARFSIQSARCSLLGRQNDPEPEVAEHRVWRTGPTDGRPAGPRLLVPTTATRHAPLDRAGGGSLGIDDKAAG
jgi:hypothetical protein